jgi:hypothetical protein
MAEDALYEIATTDAWRHLLSMLAEYQQSFEKEVVTAAKRVDFSSTEVARRTGRVEAIEFLQVELRKIGVKDGKEE